MKKYKLLLFTLVSVLVMGLFVGCGKVAEPTEADVRKALEDEGYIKDDKDDDDDDDGAASGDADSENSDSGDVAPKKEVKTEVKINKCRLNDDKDKATVKASLFVTEGPVETETEFDISFRLTDSKKWKPKSVDKESTTQKLVSGTTDEEAEKLIKNMSYNVDDLYVSGSDCEVKIDKHELNEENMTDVVTATLKGESGIKKVEFEAEITFKHAGNWYMEEKKITKSSSSYADNYKFEMTKDSFIAQIKKFGSDPDNALYIYGKSIPLSDITITDYSGSAADPQGQTYFTAEPADIGFEYDNFKFAAKFTVRYRYTLEDGWSISSLSYSEAKFTSIPFVGKFTGKNGEYPLSVEITANSDGTFTGKVTGKAEESVGDYSFTASFESFRFVEEGFRMYVRVNDWIQEPNKSYGDGLIRYNFYLYGNGDELKNDNISLKKE